MFHVAQIAISEDVRRRIREIDQKVAAASKVLSITNLHDIQNAELLTSEQLAYFKELIDDRVLLQDLANAAWYGLRAIRKMPREEKDE
jgi:hypothetical protein